MLYSWGIFRVRRREMVRKEYTYANSADTIRRLIDENEDSRRTWEETKAIARRALSHFHDDITKESGWGHSFVCPSCTERLTFVMKDRCEPPTEYPCPHCGKIATGREIENAWIAAYRNTLAYYAERCVPGVILGDEDCRAFYLKYMNFYAEHYAEYAPHGKWVGKGKVLAQSLDEAIWAMTLARGLYACRDCIPAETRADWYRRWFYPMAEFLLPQANRIHNISLWIVCAVGAIAVCFDDADLLDRALNGEYGVRRQIADGFTADGFWRECSINYHYYSLQALTDFLGVYAAVCPDDPIFDLLGKLYTVPLLFSHDGMQLQAINDGWYPVYTDGNLWQVVYTARYLAEPLLDEQIASARRRGKEIKGGLLFGYEAPSSELERPAEKPITVLPHTNFAFFRKPFYAILKSGPITDIHMHCDYLSVVLPPFSDDIGTPSYAHPMLARWYHLAVSHNTVAVDGGQPDSYQTFSVLRSHIEETEGGARATVEPGEWADISRAERTVTERDGGLFDEAVLEAESEHTFDWFFHSVGDAVYSGEGAPAEPLGADHGYQYLEAVEKRTVGDEFTASFTLPDGESLVLTAHVPAGTEVYTALSPSNPAHQKRNTVILRARGRRAVFSVSYRVIRTKEREKA